MAAADRLITGLRPGLLATRLTRERQRGELAERKEGQDMPPEVGWLAGKAREQRWSEGNLHSKRDKTQRALEASARCHATVEDSSRVR